MRIEELKLKNFRNYGETTLVPDAEVNLFYGPNGSGKTNLLEAIHYTALGRSHRVTNDANVIRTGEDMASSSVVIRNRLGLREVTIRFHPDQPQKKEILIDRKKIQKLSDLMGCLCCVIFSPEDLDLIKEGPMVRRRYMDMMISQIDRKYFTALQRYRIGLEQRNSILRGMRLNNRENLSMIGVFEETMAQAAGSIIRERRRMIRMLSERASETYRRISETEEHFSVAYRSSVKEEENIEEALCRQYQENREDDIRLGMTTTGPHRDDLILTLNDHPMKMFASQGQIRTGALSMKLSQMGILKEMSGEDPVLLLDDVMSELDRSRRASLIREIHSFQTFITCTDKDDMELESVRKIWKITSRDGNAVPEEENQNVSRETIREDPDAAMD